MVLTERTAGNQNEPHEGIGQSHNQTSYLVQREDFNIFSYCIYTGIILLTACCILKAFKHFIVYLSCLIIPKKQTEERGDKEKE